MLKKYRELVISAIIVVIYIFLNHAPIFVQLVLCTFIIGVIFFATSYHTQILFLLCISIPKIGEIGSGFVSGVNITTTLFFILIPFVLINSFKVINKKQIKLFAPIFIFTIYHSFSLLYGLAISEYDFSVPFLFSNIRDILIYSFIIIYLIFLPIKTIHKYEITNIFIFICVIAAAYELFDSLNSAYILGTGNWTELKDLNLAEYTLGIEPVFYLIPLNLILSMLLNFDNYNYKRLHLAGLIIILFTILFSLQRTVLILTILNIIVLTFPKIKNNTSIAGLLLLSMPILLYLVIKILPVVSMINDTFSSATSSNVYGINIDTSGRWDKQWPFAIATWKSAPYLGIGHSQIILMGFWNRYSNREKTQGVALALNTHNVYLEYLVQGGLIGLIFVIWFCYKIGKIMFNNSRKKLILDKYYSTLNSGLFSFWIVFLFTNILNSYFWTSGTLLPFIILYTLWGNKA